MAFDNSRKKRRNKGTAFSRASSLSSELPPSQPTKPTTTISSSSSGRSTSGRCYGCATASVEHCLTLLRALSSRPSSRHLLTERGLITELLENNLRRGSGSVRQEVRKLISFLTKDDLGATRHLGRLLERKVALAMRGARPHPDMVESVRHEMSLLAYTVRREDNCWEERLKCVFRIFLLSTKEEKTSPVVLDCITLPCLKILQDLVRPQQQQLQVQLKGGKSSSSSVASTASYRELSIDIDRWLDGDPEHCFANWDRQARMRGVVAAVAVATGEEDDKESSSATSSSKRRKEESRMKKRHVTPRQPTITTTRTREEVRRLYLMQKFGRRWRDSTFRKVSYPLDVRNPTWLRSLLFSQTSRSARQAACAVVEAFCDVHERKKDVVDLLTGFLPDLRRAGESARTLK